MRVIFVVSLLALLCSAPAMAQTPAPAAAPPAAAPTAAPPPAKAAPAEKRGGDITRDAYVERAKTNAERRFDRMDSDHDGVLTLEERQAYRAAHSRHRSPKPQ